MQLFKLSWSVEQIVCSLVVSNRPVVVFALPIHTVLLQYFLLAISSLCGAAEDLVPPADARANLVVLRFRVAEVVEIRLQRTVSAVCHIRMNSLTRDASIDPPNHTA